MTGLECVRDADLGAFALGKLSESASRIVSSHVSVCRGCANRLERLDTLTDPLVNSLRAALKGPQPTPAANPETVGPDAADQPAPMIPARVNGYEILEELGRGGTSVVYKARQTHPERLVALKMILSGSHAGPDRAARFLAEADVIATLRHPNIVRVYEVGQHKGLPYLALEYVEGGTLAERLDRQPQPWCAAAQMVEQLARAVEHAHRQGVVHRDLKPANILMSSEFGVRSSELKNTEFAPKITDFGLAKRQEADLTHTGAVLGTPSYMAPEQAFDSKSAGAAADVYARAPSCTRC